MVPQADTEIAQKKQLLAQLTKDPKLAEYRGQILEFMDLARQLESPARDRCETAILRKHEWQIEGYCLAYQAIGISLDQLAQVLQGLPLDRLFFRRPTRKHREQTADWIQKTQEEYNRQARMLSAYSADRNAAQIYGEDPVPLKSLLETAARFDSDAAKLLDQDDEFGAWIAVATGAFLIRQVQLRLLPYEASEGKGLR